MTGVRRDAIMTTLAMATGIERDFWTEAHAWAYETDNPKKPKHVTVLHMGPITSPLKAVQAAIVGEFRSDESEA